MTQGDPISLKNQLPKTYSTGDLCWCGISTQEISSNERIIQDKTTPENRKEQTIWCHKEPIVLVY